MDLVMERTRGMSLSGEEKDALRNEKLQKRARGYRLKLVDDPSSVDDALSEIELDPDRKLLESCLWKEMVEALPEDADILRHLSLMGRLPGAESKVEIIKELKDLVKSSSKGESSDRKKQLNRERKRLASAGITGTAVVPKLPKSRQLDDRLISKMSEFKKKLLNN